MSSSFSCLVLILVGYINSATDCSKPTEIASSDVEREVLEHFERGDKIFIRLSHMGRSKLKIKFGLFGLRTKRVELDNQAAERLCELIRKRRTKSALD